MAVEDFELELGGGLGLLHFTLRLWHCRECGPGRILHCWADSCFWIYSSAATEAQNLKKQHFLVIHRPVWAQHGRIELVSESSCFLLLSPGSDLTCFWNLVHVPAMMNEGGAGEWRTGYSGWGSRPGYPKKAFPHINYLIFGSIFWTYKQKHCQFHWLDKGSQSGVNVRVTCLRSSCYQGVIRTQAPVIWSFY